MTACTKYKVAPASSDAPVLLFTGTGTSPDDIVAIESLLEKNQVKYATADSSQLNEMSESQVRGYRLLIVPGGNFIEIGNSLTSHTTTKIRNAVRNGLNYLGICAGALLASNHAGYNDFNLTSGVKFGFYSAENRGIRKTAVAITVAGAETLDQYWEDGPQFTGWGEVDPDWRPSGSAGELAARYDLHNARRRGPGICRNAHPGCIGSRIAAALLSRVLRFTNATTAQTSSAGLVTCLHFRLQRIRFILVEA